MSTKLTVEGLNKAIIAFKKGLEVDPPSPDVDTKIVKWHALNEGKVAEFFKRNGTTGEFVETLEELIIGLRTNPVMSRNSTQIANIWFGRAAEAAISAAADTMGVKVPAPSVSR